jgi:hypothetical protein
LHPYSCKSNVEKDFALEVLLVRFVEKSGIPEDFSDPPVIEIPAGIRPDELWIFHDASDLRRHRSGLKRTAHNAAAHPKPRATSLARGFRVLLVPQR